MESKRFNELLNLTIFLVEDHTRLKQNYHYKNGYKCFESNNFLKDQNQIFLLETISSFSFKDVYPMDEHWGDAKLVVFEGDNICIHGELGAVLMNFLIYKVQDGFGQLNKILEELRKEAANIQASENILKINSYMLFGKKHEIQDFEDVWHIVCNIGLDLVENVEKDSILYIKQQKLKDMVKRLSNYKFQELEKKLFSN